MELYNSTADMIAATATSSTAIASKHQGKILAHKTPVPPISFPSSQSLPSSLSLVLAVFVTCANDVSDTWGAFIIFVSRCILV